MDTWLERPRRECEKFIEWLMNYDRAELRKKAMGQSPDGFDVYLETGQKRVFAAAVDWPGWCRSGRDEASALQALCDYARATLAFYRQRSWLLHTGESDCLFGG